MNVTPITSFRDEFAFLSNFYMGEFRWRNITFKSGEHAFSFAKGWHLKDSYIHDIAKYQDAVLAADTPKAAKYLGRSCNLDVESWDKHKVSLMRQIVHAKFSTGENVIGPLCNTGAAMLVEGNDWGDKFWGRVKENGKWVGLNVLGAILMEERGAWLRE